MQFSSLNSYIARYWKLKTVERNYLFKEFFTFYVSIAVNMHWSKIANSLLVVPLFLKTPFQTLLADDKQLGRLKNCSPLLLHISLSLSLSLSFSFFLWQYEMCHHLLSGKKILLDPSSPGKGSSRRRLTNDVSKIDQTRPWKYWRRDNNFSYSCFR